MKAGMAGKLQRGVVLDGHEGWSGWALFFISLFCCHETQIPLIPHRVVYPLFIKYLVTFINLQFTCETL